MWHKLEVLDSRIILIFLIYASNQKTFGLLFSTSKEKKSTYFIGLKKRVKLHDSVIIIELTIAVILTQYER